MRRFDLLDEFTSVAAPRLSRARDRDLDHRNGESDRRSHAWSDWRYGVTGVVGLAVLATAMSLFGAW